MVTSKRINVPAATTGRRRAPGPRGSFLLGSMGELRRDMIGFLGEITREYGDIVRFTVAGVTVHLLNHPDYLRHVLLTNHHNYDKKSFEYRAIRRAFGLGLFTSDGELWLRQRRLMQPAFHQQRIAGLGENIVAHVASRVDGWRPHAEQGTAVDIATEMVNLAMNVATWALFSTGLRGDDEGDMISRDLGTIVDYCLYRSTNPLTLPPSVPSRRNNAYNQAMRRFDGVIQRIIDERRRGDGDAVDLISMLLAARDEDTGEGMADTQVRDEVATLLLGGHDTTANLLSWAWYELSQHPDVEAKLHAELDQVLGGRLPTVADLARLPYTKAVLDETLRLYPVPWMERRADKADTIGGYDIKAGSLIYISPYLMHRHPTYWPDPERYDPGRFAPEQPAQQARFAYLPFGGGPRQCIGNRLAMLEALLTVATVAQRYRLRLVPGHPVDTKMQITTSPRYGLKMTIEQRSSAKATKQEHAHV